MKYEVNRRIFVNGTRFDELEKLEEEPIEEGQAWEVVRVNEPDSLLVRINNLESTMGMQVKGVFLRPTDGTIFIPYDKAFDPEKDSLGFENSMMLFTGCNFVLIETSQYPKNPVCERDDITMPLPEAECSDGGIEHICSITLVPMPMTDEFQKANSDADLKFPIAWVTEKHRKVPALCGSGDDIDIPEMQEYIMLNRNIAPYIIDGNKYSDDNYFVDLTNAECKRINVSAKTSEGIIDNAVVQYLDDNHIVHIGRIVSSVSEFAKKGVERGVVEIDRFPENESEIDKTTPEMHERYDTDKFIYKYLGIYPKVCTIISSCGVYDINERRQLYTLLSQEDRDTLNDIRICIAMPQFNVAILKQKLLYIAYKYIGIFSVTYRFYLFLNGRMKHIALIPICKIRSDEVMNSVDKYKLLIDNKVVDEGENDA